MKLFHIISQIQGVFTDVDHPNQGGSLGDSELASVLEFVFIAAGIVSITMVIIGGYWYTLSAGDPQRVKKAKDTILYAIIGLVISVSAWVIVGFVLGQTG
jgi:hypothetical protein